MMHFMDIKPNDEMQPPIEIPPDKMSEESLIAVIENFIFREGTDYGLNEVDHQTKIRQVKKQIDSGEVLVVFDPNTESVTLLTKVEWKKLCQRLS